MASSASRALGPLTFRALRARATTAGASSGSHSPSFGRSSGFGTCAYSLRSYRTWPSATWVSGNVLRSSFNMQQRWHGHGHGHSHGDDDPDAPTVKVTYVYEKDGTSHTVDGKVGMNVLRVAHANGLDLEGACECSLACSTCHVVLEDKTFDMLEEPTDDENDMLDLAFGLTETSRLGCQVILTEDMEGAVFTIPSATRNMYVDGHVPKPH